MRRAIVVVAIVAAWGCSGARSAQPAAEDRAVVNARAFARLYGVVRWFHPSDEAAALDWNRFASAGIAHVRGATSAEQLAAALTELVHPIAPAVVVARTDRPPPPAATPTGETTWWQHRGPGLTGSVGPYISKRRGKPAPSVSAAAFVMMGRSIDAKPYRGKRIRLVARTSAADGGSAQLWLRVDRPGGTIGFFDNMDGRAITAATWTEATIEGTVDADAEKVVLGALMLGNGTTRYDDFRLDVADPAGAWTPVPLDNAGFDQQLTGWTGSATVEPDAKGGAVATLGAAEPPVVEEPFEERPRADEVSVVDLGDGLSAWVPLVLAVEDGRTRPAGDPAALAALLAAPADPAADRVADLVVAWNVLAHFYPYLDVIGEDWKAALDTALRDASDDRSADDHVVTLRRLTARAKDGHIWVRIRDADRAALPIRFGWVEDRVIVLASGDDRVRRGDVVVTIDGVPATQRATELAALSSGSPQWTRWRGTGEIAMGAPDISVVLGLERAGAPVDVTVPRARGAAPEAFDHPALGEIEPGIWYVDMSRAELAAIDAAMPKLAAARVIVDMRGYPNGNSDILTHIIRKPDTVKWMHVGHLVRPFQQAITAWDDYGWELQRAAPRLEHVVFITGPGAISYAESVMGYAQYEGIPIIGAASAGTNGNVQSFELPTGAKVSFTGMRVTTHDGKQHHLIGVPPTIPAEPTIAGIAAGRDEVLEAAIAAVKR